MALAKRNEAANVTSDINVTPMVDVMLVLLIIFMVVTPMLQHGKQVDMLAQVNSPKEMQDADKEDAMVIAITRDDKVFLGNDSVKVEDITQMIKDRLANRTENKAVFLKADARAKFGWVVEVVDNVRAAGVDQLGLLTDQKKSGNIPPPPSAPAPNGGL
jgi:biopolymer transport protein ExbD/biopolymer transport protein TolR